MSQAHFFRFILEWSDSNSDTQTKMSMNIDSDDFSKAQEQCLDFRELLRNRLGLNNVIGTIRVMRKEFYENS